MFPLKNLVRKGLKWANPVVSLPISCPTYQLYSVPIAQQLGLDMHCIPLEGSDSTVNLSTQMVGYQTNLVLGADWSPDSNGRHTGAHLVLWSKTQEDVLQGLCESEEIHAERKKTKQSTWYTWNSGDKTSLSHFIHETFWSSYWKIFLCLSQQNLNWH